MAESETPEEIIDHLREEITGNRELRTAIREIEHAFSDFETNPKTKWTAEKLRILVTNHGEELMAKPKSFKVFDEWYKETEIESRLQAIERNAKGISPKLLREGKRTLLETINNVELRKDPEKLGNVVSLMTEKWKKKLTREGQKSIDEFLERHGIRNGKVILIKRPLIPKEKLWIISALEKQPKGTDLEKEAIRWANVLRVECAQQEYSKLAKSVGKRNFFLKARARWAKRVK